MRKFFFACLLIFAFVFADAQQSLSFYSEYIDFSIDGKYFSVNGIYRFCNNSGKPVNNTILFPFAVGVSFIDSISIKNLENFKKITYRKRERDLVFPLSVTPYDSVDINVFYRQPVSRVNSYVLRTTQSWGTPLRKAAYTLTTDKDQRILSFSIEPDSSAFNSENRIYYWNKVDFNPRTDFEIVIDR
ncbi:MAG: DUF4424 family protein [Bacteroidales bacterium]|nr:DUF4424 family protein [Bacteroidales bacterium]